MNKVQVHGRHEIGWITIPKDDYDSMNRTIGVLSDEEIMAQIRKGKRKDVKSRDLKEVAKELGI